jgi:hypothetical protein
VCRQLRLEASAPFFEVATFKFFNVPSMAKFMSSKTDFQLRAISSVEVHCLVRPRLVAYSEKDLEKDWVRYLMLFDELPGLSKVHVEMGCPVGGFCNEVEEANQVVEQLGAMHRMIKEKCVDADITPHL